MAVACWIVGNRTTKQTEDMMRYRMDDGAVIDTANATQKWDEETNWDGRNHISKATGSQWIHQTLYQSRKGRYYVEQTSQWQGSTPHAGWLGKHAAARWLLTNGHELPAELAELYDEICE